MQPPLITPRSGWRPPSLSELPSWAGAKRVAVDTETCDPHLKTLGPSVRTGGYVVGYSFAIEDGPKHYVPFRHAGGDNVDPDKALAYLRDQAKHFDGEVVGANLGYDLDYLLETGIDWPKVRRFRDVLVADPLIYELHDRYNLDEVAKRWGFEGKEEELLRRAARDYGVDPKGGMWRLPGRYVGPYAEADAEQPLKILRRQEKAIDEQDLWEVYDLESDLLPVLVRMRRRGVRVDEDRLDEVERWSLEEERQALKEVKDRTGFDVGVGNVWKADALAPVLESIGVEVELTPKTKKPRVAKDALQNLDHPVAKAIERARQVNKLRTTFAASIRRYMVNGRVHCNFNQMRREREDGSERGAAYGRMSADHPNMQQQPARDAELGPLWRSIYIPEDGALWGCMDYSQQEPRMLVHFAVKAGCGGAIAARDNYRNNPKADSHQMMADMSGLPRKEAKILGLAQIYGQGGASLCRDLGLPTEWCAPRAGRGSWTYEYFATEAEARAFAQGSGGRGKFWEGAGPEGRRIIDQYNAALPFVKEVARMARNLADKRGWVRTLSGRRCRFPGKAGDYWWTHKALNRIIQGSSADQAKKALVDCDREGFFVQLQVHDELDASVADASEGRRIAEVMQATYELELPFKVDVEIGPNWGEIKGV